jgi:APA family basic amino acid/polyamine antiporter
VEGDLVSVYAQLLLVSTVTTLVPYTFSAGAQLKALLVDGTSREPHFTRSLTVAAIAMGYTIFAFYGAGANEVYWGFLVILVGIPLYIAILRSRRVSRSERSDDPL